jgi:hypothetical protein
MVTLRRENSDAVRHDYDRRLYDRNRDALAVRTYDERKVSKEYLDYLWAELDRTEKRRILRPEEYSRGAGYERKYNRRENYSRETVKHKSSARNSAIGRLDKRGVIAIVAYFLIVAVIVSLIIINGGGNTTYDPATGSQAEISVGAGDEINSTAGLPLISEEALGIMILSDGSAEDINLLAREDGYVYHKQTNWFDKLCDALSFIAGG